MSHCARKRIKSLRHNQVRMTNRELSRVFRPKTCTRSSLSHKILRLPNLVPYTTRWLRGAVIDLACPLFHLIWKKRSVSCWPTIRSRSTQSVSYASSDTCRDRSHPPLSLAASVVCHSKNRRLCVCLWHAYKRSHIVTEEVLSELDCVQSEYTLTSWIISFR